MADITVHIMLHGLIALAPINDANGLANQMTALLVDARQRPPGVEMECFAEHFPRLTVRTNTSAECVLAGCEAGNGSRCTCQLDRHEISISTEPAVQPTPRSLSTRPPSVLPFDDIAAGNFGYVANLSRLNANLDLRFRDATVPPPILAARMKFPMESVTSCYLGSLSDEGGNNIHALSFRPLHEPERVADMSQAVAQMAMAHFTLPSAPTQTVTLTISKFGDPTSARNLTLRPTPNPNGSPFFEIDLTNERSDLRADDPCEDGVGRDFAFLYELAENPPAWSARPIPHIKYIRWKSARDLEAPGCDPTKTPLSRPVCPLGSFDGATTTE